MREPCKGFYGEDPVESSSPIPGSFTKLAVIALVLCVLPALAVSAKPNVDYDGIVRATITDHIRPRFDRLAETSSALSEATREACAEGNNLQSPKVNKAFHQVVKAWASAQHLRWGPANKQFRHQRISFGSDPKNYVGRQLRRLIAKADPAALDLETFRKKSIAIQGLTALERLVYGKSAKKDASSYRCALGMIIARNIAGIARDLALEWRDPKGHTAIMTSPGPGNPLYQNWEEAAMAAFKPLSGGLRFMLEIKIKDPLQKSLERARPRYVTFWRSGATETVLRANLEALRDLYVTGGFSAGTAKQSGKLDTRIRNGFAQALKILAGINMPIKDAVKDRAARVQLERLVAVLENLWKQIAFGSAKTLGLSVGFNEFDGD